MNGSSTVVRFGKIGCAGQQVAPKDHGTAEAAQKAADKLVAEKTKGGYVEKTSSATTAAGDEEGSTSHQQQAVKKQRGKTTAKTTAKSCAEYFVFGVDIDVASPFGNDVGADPEIGDDRWPRNGERQFVPEASRARLAVGDVVNFGNYRDSWALFVGPEHEWLLSSEPRRSALCAIGCLEPL